MSERDQQARIAALEADVAAWKAMTSALEGERDTARQAQAQAERARDVTRRVLGGILHDAVATARERDAAERERDEQIERAFVAQQDQINKAWALDAAEQRVEALVGALAQTKAFLEHEARNRVDGTYARDLFNVIDAALDAARTCPTAG